MFGTDAINAISELTFCKEYQDDKEISLQDYIGYLEIVYVIPKYRRLGIANYIFLI